MLEHPNYDNGRNMRVPGKFKDVLNGDILEEFVGLILMPKMYTFKTVNNDDTKKGKGVKNLCLKKICPSNITKNFSLF